MSDDEDIPRLPTDTLAILQQFYDEQNEKNEMLMNLENGNLENAVQFDEDWQLSQFWYDETTTSTLAKIAAKSIGENGSICLISCPTLYVPIKKALDKNCEVKLFEYDQRFKIHGEDFVHYDFNHPTRIADDMHKKFDIVIADPPFLSEECLTKTSETIKLLAKDKIIVCTGTIMNDVIQKTLNLSMRQFKPKHKNNLANDFSSYSNFDLDLVINS